MIVCSEISSYNSVAGSTVLVHRLFYDFMLFVGLLRCTFPEFYFFFPLFSGVIFSP